MKIVNVYISILQFRRALQILGILTKHSLGELFSHTRFSRRRRRKVQKTVHTTPERIRMTIEDLGPTFVNSRNCNRARCRSTTTTRFR